MQLIQNGTQGPTSVPTKQAAVGTPGYAYGGPPGATPSSIWDPDVANTILAELAGIVLAGGLTLSPTNNAQVIAALKVLFGQLAVANTWSGVQTHSNSIVLDNSVWLQGKDTGGTPRNVLLYGSDNFVHIIGGTAGTTIQNAALTANNIILDDTGNATIRGFIAAAIGTGFAHAAAFYTSSTFTVPATGMIEVEVWGAGGGSGGTLGAATAGGPGCGGGYARSILSGLTPGSTIAVTVGTGGSAGNQTPTNGGNGGSSSFGAFLSATGGQGGFGSAAGAVNSVQSPGSGFGGNIVNLTGDVGMCGFALGGGSMLCAHGGAAPLGGARAGGGASSITSGNGPGLFPGGGAGGCVNQNNGSSGAAGLVIVRY